jgi:tetratricopeptide (TPR) repeat protein
MKNRNIILGLITLLVILLSSSLSADEKYGRESLFLMGAGARAMGMGGAFTAVGDDVSSVFYNPAGLGFLEYRELTVFHTSLFENTSYMFGSFAYPILDFGTVGVSGMRLGTDNIVFRDRLGQLSENDYSNGQYWVSYGLKIFNSVAIGANLKFLSQSLGTYSASTGSFDIGILTHYKNLIFIGINVQDIYSGNMKLGSTGDDIPYNIKGGLAIKHDFQNIGMILAADLDKTEKNKGRFHFGAELNLKKNVFARIGYDRTEIAVGGGLRYRLLAFDYAYKAHSDLGGTHRLSVSFFFGPTLSKQREKREERLLGAERDRSEQNRQQQIRNLMAKADQFYDAEVWDSAVFYYNQVLAYDLENIEVINRLKEISQRAASETQVEIDTRAGQIASEQLLEKYSTSADSLFTANEYENARLEYLKILQLDSTNLIAQERLGEIQNIFERRASDLIASGESLLNQERYADAVVEFTEAQKLQPDNGRIRQRIAYAKGRLLMIQKIKSAVELLNTGDTAQAVVTFQEILVLDPNEQIANDYLQKIQTQSELRPVTIDALKADAEIWQVYLDGLRFFSDGQYEQAIEKWQAVLDKYPGSEDTRENMRQAQLRMGN